MKRPLLTGFLFYFSLAALALVLAGWVRSYWRSEWIVFSGHDQKQSIYEVGYNGGRWYFMSEHGVFGALHTSSGSDLASGWWSYGDANFSSDSIEFAGFELWRGQDVMIFVPFSAISLVLIIIAAISFRRPRSTSAKGFEINLNKSKSDIACVADQTPTELPPTSAAIASCLHPVSAFRADAGDVAGQVVAAI